MKLRPDFSQRPSKIVVNLNALEHNFATIKKYVGKSKVMGVVKANAYGHGLIECAKRLELAGIDYLGVALIEEGESLRNAGIKVPIHVFGGILSSQIARCLQSNLEITASSISKLLAIDNIAAQLGMIAKVHLKIDTGMGRIGVRPESAKLLIDESLKCKNVYVCGVFSHFATSDEVDLSFSNEQFEKFLPLLSYAKDRIGTQLLGHISNSAAIYQLSRANLDMVRPGLSLYGVASSPHLKGNIELRPVMSVQSQIVYFKVVKAGDSVSYGRTWYAKKDTRVVTVPIGYGDGYLRSLSNRASVIIRGKRYPIIGRICMDQIMIDIGNDEAFNGDDVVLIGSNGSEQISVEELADWAESIPHEILSLLNLRMEREFIG